MHFEEKNLVVGISPYNVSLLTDSGKMEELFNYLEPLFNLKVARVLMRRIKGRWQRIVNIGELCQPLLTAVSVGSAVSSLLCSKYHTALLQSKKHLTDNNVH